MPLRTAVALCPDAVFLPVRSERYAEVSRQVMTILRRYSPVVEQVSIDEAFLDVAGTQTLHGTPEHIAVAIRADIRAELGLTASIGVASSRLVAKVASDLRKPDALVVVPAGAEAAFLDPLPIGRLWGVGEKTRSVLDDHGVRTIGDLARLPHDVLRRRLGEHGASLADRARGIDPTPVGVEADGKSVSHEHTLEHDTRDPEVIERSLLALSEGVASRLRSAGLRASTIAVKVRDSDFVTRSRQVTLRDPTDEADAIYRTALDLARPQVRGIRVRLLGVAATGLTERAQLALFAHDEDRRRRATSATDEVRRRFGPRALIRARLLEDGVPEPFERDPFRGPEAPGVGRAGLPADEPRDAVTHERAEPGP
jgi:DNA polymerase-4